MDIVSRNIVFGVQDGVVTTIGLLSGVILNKSTFTIYDRKFVILSIFVSSASMAIGSYQSERTAENFKPDGQSRWEMFLGAVTMFISYFLSGLMVLVPYSNIRVPNPSQRLPYSVLISAILLFLAGWQTASMAGADTWRNAIETMILGIVAVGIGYFSGRITNI